MIKAVPYTQLWFGVGLWSLITGGVLFFTGWELKENYLFAFDSRPASAFILHKWVSVSHSRRGGSSTTSHLEYRYDTQGMACDIRTSVSDATYGVVNEGDQLPVIYVQDNPTDNRIEMSAEISRVRVTTVVAILASLLLVIGGIFGIRYYWRRNRLQRWLLECGSNCVGTVTGVPYDLVGKYQTKRYYLTFRFGDDAGRERLGKTWYLTPGAEAAWREGAPIRVRFDPRNSEWFTVDLSALPT